MAAIPEDEKKFENLPYLSPKVRMRIIDKMDSGDRCRFTRCSKLSQEEAWSSKNYIYGLALYYTSAKDMHIDISNSLQDEDGYTLTFTKTNGIMKKTYYELSNDQESWESELEVSKTLFQHAYLYLKQKLENHQNAIKLLRINNLSSSRNALKNFNFGVSSLKNLEFLDIMGNMNIQQFLSTMERPLRELWIGDNDEDIPDQIYEITENIAWDIPNITNEQFRRITAKSLTIPVGKLTERNIFSFIRSWQNGTLRREIDTYYWKVEDSNFEITKFLRLLRIRTNRVRNGVAEIKHFEEPGVSAILEWNEAYVEFKPIIKQE